jgi:hypothetical protein
MSIDVNSANAFTGDAGQTLPGNGQQFTITRSFAPADTVTVSITSKQDPTFGTDTTLYAMQFNSLTLT